MIFSVYFATPFYVCSKENLSNCHSNSALSIADYANVWFTFGSMQIYTLDGWIVVIFSAERLYCVWFPLRSSVLINGSFRKKVLLGLIIVSAILCLFPLIMYDVVIRGVAPNTYKTCRLRDDEVVAKPGFMSTYWIILDKVITYAGPCSLVLVCNILLIICLNLSKFTGAKQGGSQSKDNDIVKTLVIISTLFVITNLPYVVFNTWVDTVSTKYPLIDVTRLYKIGDFNTSLTSVNYMVNFFIYSTRFDFFWPTLLNKHKK